MEQVIIGSLSGKVIKKAIRSDAGAVSILFEDGSHADFIADCVNSTVGSKHESWVDVTFSQTTVETYKGNRKGDSVTRETGK